MPSRLNLRELTPHAHQIREGDLLLWRRNGLLSRIIAIAGRSVYSHAGMAVRFNGTLLVAEVREWRGARLVTLASQVRRAPGRIDVLRANARDQNTSFNRYGAVRWMVRLAGSDYGYASVLAASLLHVPLVRLLTPADTDDARIDEGPPFCSQAVAMAYRVGGGVDVVPNLADRLTEPADLARSGFFEYLMTLSCV